MSALDPSIPFRITFLLPTLPTVPVGGYRVVYEYANGLARRGHEVTVLHAWRVGDGPGPSAQGIRARLGRARNRALLGLGPTRINWHQVEPQVNLRSVPSLDERHVPPADALVATAWQTAEAAAMLPENRGEQFYLIQHHETWAGGEARVDATWHLPQHKVVISRWLLDLAHRKGLRDVVHIPNAIDLGQFRVRRPIAGRGPRVAMLFSDLAWKGTEDGIRALELARQQCSSLQAVLFGTTTPPTVPDWIEVRVNPSQAVLAEEIYNGSSIYLCPSHGEGWHLPPAEAMASGCALVSTDIGGVRDYAEPETTALLVPPGDVDGLAAAVVRLCRDTQLRHRIAEQGHRRIAEFSWERSVLSIERYVADHLRPKDSPS